MKVRFKHDYQDTDVNYVAGQVVNIVSKAKAELLANSGIASLVKESTKKPIAVATRCSANHLGTPLAGTVAGETYRYSHVMRTEAGQLQLVYCNNYPLATSESSNAQPITIAASIEYGGQVMRLFFNGKATATIDQGGIAVTDPVWRDIPVGATFWTRTWVSVPADGNTYPQGLIPDSALGEGKGPANTVLTAGVLPTVAVAGFGPAVIVGVPEDPDAIAFALLGDSIVTSPGWNGWPIGLVENDYGYSIISRPSSTVASMQSNSPNAYRMRLLRYFTHGIVNFGTNDFDSSNSLATQEALMADFWDALVTMGLEVYQSTTMPRTTSTDAFATTANQTVYNTNNYNGKRVAFNQNLRAKKYPVKVLDVAAQIETAVDSGIWKVPAFTTDGIHPLAAGRTAVITGVKL